jgi:hypothetical protein
VVAHAPGFPGRVGVWYFMSLALFFQPKKVEAFEAGKISIKGHEP